MQELEMNDKNNNAGIDWSKDHWKEMLIEQRRFLWTPDIIERYAQWMNVRQGMTAVDVGCGLGFLGYTYWPHFGNGGKYIGIDQSEDLLKEASQAAKEWAKGGEAEFKKGDSYNLPLDDDSADWIMCQTLLMHLDRPREALSEMIRILKPGGLIMCKEPDNLSGILARQYLSAADFGNEDYLRAARVQLAIHDGRRKLGRGDQSIGNKVAHMLRELGMVDIDVKMKELVYFLEPPYENEQQQHRLKQLRKQYSDSKGKDLWRSKGREEFLAGGGDLRDFEQHCETMEKYFDRALKQMDSSEFAACGGYFSYIIRARKPQ
jgi:ubiquinone/menaquinone biosynthesis C-methylase UbiE